MSIRRSSLHHTPTAGQNRAIDALLDADDVLAQAEKPLQAMAALRPLSVWERDSLVFILSQRFEIYVIRSAIERSIE